MEISKKERRIYSLWLIPIVLASVFMILSLTGISGYVRYDGTFAFAGVPSGLDLICAGIALLGVLFMVLTSRQKQHRKVLFLFIAAFGLVVAIENALGVLAANKTISLSTSVVEFIVFLLWEFYVLAALIYALVQRKRVIIFAAYSRSPEYREKMRAREQKTVENELQKLREADGAAPASARTQRRFAEAVSAPPPSEPAPAAPVAPVGAAAAPPAPETNAAATVDLNSCTTQELLDLPGMSLADAMGIVQEREANGAYRSVGDCVRRAALKPHLAARYLDRLAVSEETPVSAARRGRTLDL